MQIVKLIAWTILIVGAGLLGYELADATIASRSPEQSQAIQSEPALAVTVAKPKRMIFSNSISAVGTVRAIRSIDLRLQANGRIEELKVEPGSNVSEGDLLIRLDETAARAGLELADATLTEAQATIARQRQLRENGAVSEAAYQAAVAALQRAAAERDLAEETLKNRSLDAPFDGVVGLTDHTEGELLDTDTVVATLDDLSLVEVDFRVPEQAYPSLSSGLGVELRSAAWPDRVFYGEITALDTRIDAGTRSLALRATVDNADGALKAGMFMQVMIAVESRENLAVPEHALTVAGPKTMVFTVQDGVALQVEIETGQSLDGFVEVRAGLSDANAVVLDNLHRLSDGMAVSSAGEMPPETEDAQL